MLMKAVDQNGYNLALVEKKWLEDEELVEHALRHNGMNLAHVPEKYCERAE